MCTTRALMNQTIRPFCIMTIHLENTRYVCSLITDQKEISFSVHEQSANCRGIAGSCTHAVLCHRVVGAGTFVRFFRVSREKRLSAIQMDSVYSSIGSRPRITAYREDTHIIAQLLLRNLLVSFKINLKFSKQNFFCHLVYLLPLT